MTDPFDPAAVSEETARFNRDLYATLAPLPRPYEVPVALTRAARAAGEGLFPPAGPLESARWQDIPGAEANGTRARLTEPEGEVRGTYLHFHGGGWTFGAPDQYDIPNRRIAEATGARVVSVAYRLAPEHRWPAQRDDAVAGATWVLDRFPGPLVIGGESAGAHLGLVTALALRDAGKAERLAGMALLYGMYDMAMTPSMRAWGERWLILSTPIVHWFVVNLLGPEGGPNPRDPDLSPLHARLGGLPPAFLACGTEDPLLDDTLFMAARLEAAGVAVERLIAPGGAHAYDQFDLEVARRTTAAQDRFIAARLGGGAA